MPRRAHILVSDEIYHVFNRSVGREEIFNNKRALNRAKELFGYYRFPHKIRYSRYLTLPFQLQQAYATEYMKRQPTVELYAFSLMPNHYHLLIKQLHEKGIAKFVANMQNSFAKYFNLKNERHGTLFEHAYKAKRVETDEEFLHLSRYIHLNPITSYHIEIDKLVTYPWTSFPNYLKEGGFVNSKKILEMFPTKEKYLKFVTDQADYQRKLGDIKHLLIDR